MAQWLVLINMFLFSSNALPVTVPNYVDTKRFRTDGNDDRFYSKCMDHVQQDCEEAVKDCKAARSLPLNCAYSDPGYPQMDKDQTYQCGKCVNQADTNRSWTLFCGYDAQSWVGLVHYQGQDCQELLHQDGIDFSLVPASRRDGESVLRCYGEMYPCSATCSRPRSTTPVKSQAECQCDVCTFHPKPNHSTISPVWYNIFEKRQDIQV